MTLNVSPLPGDRAAHDVTNHPTLHASDLEAGTPIYHVPAGATTGDVLTWDGTKWGAGESSITGYRYRQFMYEVVDGDLVFLVDTDGYPLFSLETLE
jgi:hypothetical protein